MGQNLVFQFSKSDFQNFGRSTDQHKNPDNNKGGGGHPANLEILKFELLKFQLFKFEVIGTLTWFLLLQQGSCQRARLAKLAKVRHGSCCGCKKYTRLPVD